MTNGVKALFVAGSSGDPDSMIFGITTASSPQTFTLPCGNVGVYDAEIDWGDDSTSTITTYNDADLAHSYTTAGDYTITITGTLPHIHFNNGGDKLLVKDISQWGDLGTVTCTDMFYGCANLTVSAIDGSGFSAITDFSHMFRGCAALNHSLSGLDVSSGTTFSFMFRDCTAFNQSLNGWTVSSGINFSYMFYNCIVFNQPLNLWNVSSGTNFSFMFRNCPNFNQALNGWNVSGATTFSSMFNGCDAFNQDLSAWDWDSIAVTTSMWASGGGLAMTAANADNFYLGIYTSRAAVTWATPTMDTTSMATPTGTYQYAATPSTGQEYIYALENDDDAEGFYTWTITP